MNLTVIENKIKRKRAYRLIDGNILRSEENCIGYCWNDLHPGFVTLKLMQQHECLEKGCPFFERFENRPYWIQRQKRKDERISGKMKKLSLAQKQEDIFCDFRKITLHIEGFAVAGCEFKDGYFVLRCVALQPVELRKYVGLISQKYSARIQARFIKNTYEMRKMLVDKIRKDY